MKRHALPYSRFLRLAGVLLLWLLGLGAASPASDLYQTALKHLNAEYYGWSAADLNTLNSKYAALLKIRCAPQADRCSYATGRAVLADLLREFGDLHTNVRDPEAATRLQEVMQDQAVPRTGLRVARVEGGLLVVSVMPGSPAERAGVRLYDLFPQVNDQDAGKRSGQNAAIGPNEFMRLERQNQPLKVTLVRPGQSLMTLELPTETLKARDVPTLAWAGADLRTAVIVYPTFLAAENSAAFLKLVQEAQRQGARQLVIDLRFNTGGSLTECVAAASIFGPVQYRSQYRSGGGYTYVGQEGRSASVLAAGALAAGEAHRLWTGPAAVLIGPDTASCAEVFTFYARQAGALAVGTPTRGVANSGVVFESLPDGGLLAVSILRAYTAQGLALPSRLRPDIPAPTDIAALTQQGLDTTLQAALKALDAAGQP